MSPGTYIYSFENGDMEVIEIVRVVQPSLVNTVNVWLGQQVTNQLNLGLCQKGIEVSIRVRSFVNRPKREVDQLVETYCFN